MKKQNLYWKLTVAITALLLIILEVNSYTNTKGSIVELYLFAIHEQVMFVAIGLMLLCSAFLIFSKSKVGIVLSILAMIFFLLLFFPTFDMEGVDHSF